MNGDLNYKKEKEVFLLTKELLYYLNKIEETDEGRQFHPNIIRSVRVMDTMTLNNILKRLNELTKDT